MGKVKLKGENTADRFLNLLEKHCAKVMSRERFDVFVGWSRAPQALMIGEELNYFSSKDEKVLGVLIRDRSDRDYGFVILGRDAAGRFRAINCKMNYPNRVKATHDLLAEIKKEFEKAICFYPQGDEERHNKLDLFHPVVDESKMHDHFIQLRDEPHNLAAKAVISEMMNHYQDVDGNFVEQFQTSGFNSRLWELYLHAALLELGLYVSKPNPAPDFEVSDGVNKVFVEAVTVNPSDDEKREGVNFDPFTGRSVKEILELRDTKAPIKFGSPLWSKLTRRNPYWEMEHVKGKPLVFAIADFHEPRSMTWSHTALISYLYGVKNDFHYDENGQLVIATERIFEHQYKDKKIPSGFFLQKKSENVSAILFSSTGTMSKFNRMGSLAGFSDPRVSIFREVLYHDHDPNASLPLWAIIHVKEGEAKESWSEGLSLFHNPHALHPIDPSMFPNIAHHFYKDGQIVSNLPEFHPYCSMNYVIRFGH